MNRSALHQAALDYAEIWGWHIFPCLPLDKPPAVDGGWKAATTDPDQIDDWWGYNPEYNIGWSCGHDGKCVVEDDPGADLTGLDLPDTYEHYSPRGGAHRLYEGAIACSAGKLAPHIDTRGPGGYVLLPPSRTVDGVYRLKASRPFAPVPLWIAKALAPVEKIEAISEVGDDLPHNVERARHIIREAIRTAGPHGEKDPPDTYVLVQNLRDYCGLSAEMCHTLMMEVHHTSESAWMRQTVANCFKYGQNTSGARAPASPSQTFALAGGSYNGSTAVSDTANLGSTPSPPAKPWPKFLTIAEMRLRAATEKKHTFLWQGRILRDEPNLLTGDGGIGKTTMVSNAAIGVAAGCGLLGHSTTQAPVVVLIAEDRYLEFGDNLAAVAKSRSIDLETLDVATLSTDSEGWDNHVIADIDAMGQVATTEFFEHVVVPQLEAKPGCLFVIDPLAEFINFDANNPRAARACANFLRSLARRFDITPWAISHPSKAAMADGSHYGGDTQIKAAFAALATLRLTDPKDKGHGERKALTYEVIKMRYGAPPSETNFYRLQDTPAYKLDPADGMTPNNIDKMVFNLIKSRVTNEPEALLVTKTNTIYGPEKASLELGISAKIYTWSVERLAERGLLVYTSDPGKRKPSTWALGPNYNPDEDPFRSEQ